MLRAAVLRLAAAVLSAIVLYPSAMAAQGDTLRAGQGALASLTLRIGTDSSDTWSVRSGARRLLVTYVEEVSPIPGGYLIVGRNVWPNGVTVSLDSVAVATGTLSPLWHADSARGGRTRVHYDAGRVTGTRVDSTGASQAIDRPAPGGVHDYSMVSRLVNLLPLRPGYDAVLPSVDIHRGAQYMRVRVLVEEDVEVRGARVPAWKVETDFGAFKVLRWIDRATRRDLRTVVSNRGMEMVVEHR